MAEKSGFTAGVYVLLERGSKDNPEALFLHRTGSKYQNDTFMTPGGGVEPGEPPLAAAVREPREETGVVIDPADLVLGYVMFRGAHDETGNRVDIVFRTRKWGGEPKNNEPHKCDELRWLRLRDLPESVPEYLRKAIGHMLSGEMYSEFDWPAK